MTLFINGKTYEASELIDYVKNLEKENAELKEKLSNAETSNEWYRRSSYGSLFKQIAKAKKIIRKLLSAYTTYADDFDDRDNEIVEESAQFLSEVENELS